MWGASGTGKSRETSSIGAVVQNAITQLQNERSLRVKRSDP